MGAKLPFFVQRFEKYLKNLHALVKYELFRDFCSEFHLLRIAVWV